MRDVILASRRTAYFGHSGEQGITKIKLFVSEWLSEYPNGTPVLLYQRPDGKTYPLVIETEDSAISAVLSQLETEIPGYVRIEAQWHDNGKVVKIGIFTGCVTKALSAQEKTPDKAPAWLDTAAEIAALLGGGILGNRAAGDRALSGSLTEFHIIAV